MMIATRQALLVLLCAATGVAADERIVFRSELQDGRVVYGGAPVKGARQSVRIQLERHAANPQQEEAAQRALALTRAQILRDADARAARLRQLDNQASDAYDAVRQAQEERDRGREVKEGERQGRRLLPAYWQRQRALETRVRAVQARLAAIVDERARLQY